VQLALRDFADWQRASARMAWHEPPDILIFGHLRDYYDASFAGGHVSECHLFVQCDADWDGAVDDCEKLAFRSLATRGVFASLTNSVGLQGAPQGKRRVPSKPGRTFVGDSCSGRPVPAKTDDPFVPAMWTLMHTQRQIVLEPFEDPLLCETSKQNMRRRAVKKGLDVWCVSKAQLLEAREGPGLAEKVVGTLFHGDEVATFDDRNGWLRVVEWSNDLAAMPLSAWVSNDVLEKVTQW